ncbi:MAG: sulfotransferase [Pseudomonadota bacterium]
MVVPGPDFVSIGMPLSGTRWLYDQLSAHEDVRLPKIKELHFLDRGIRAESAKKRLERQSQRERRDNLDAADTLFLDRYINSPVSTELVEIEADYHRPPKQLGGRFDRTANIALEARHFEWYLSLFEPFKPKITGDITPGYYAVNREKIAQFRSYCPKAKQILIVRRPADVVISKLKKRVRKGVMTKSEVDRSFGAGPDRSAFFQAVCRVAPTRGFQNWSSVFGEDNIHVIIFDDIVADAETVRQELCRYLGLSVGPDSFSLAANHNRKQRKEGEEVVLDIDREAISEALHEETERCKALFGGSTANW